MKIKIISNEAFKLFFIFFIIFVWVNYYKKNFSKALPLALLLTIIIYVCLKIIFKYLNKNKTINKEDKYQIEKIKTQLLLNSNKENNLYLRELFNIKSRNNIIRINSKKFILVDLLKTELSINSISKVIEIAKFNKTNSCLVICMNYENTIINLSKSIVDFDIRFIDLNDLYFKLIKPQKYFPQINYVIKPKIKYKLKEIINIALNQKNTKKYVFYGLVTLFFSFFTFFKIYYIVIGTLLVSLAAISKILNYNKNRNILQFNTYFEIKKNE